jgi:hypothetical protein
VVERHAKIYMYPHFGRNLLFIFWGATLIILIVLEIASCGKVSEVSYCTYLDHTGETLNGYTFKYRHGLP